MMRPLPMQFRERLSDEAFPGYLSECAERYSAHPSALLELAGCPSSLRRAAFIAEPQAERLAGLLGQSSESLTAAIYTSAASSPGIPRVAFHETLMRRSHLVARKRRLSPAAMRASNHVRALSLVEAIGFCPDTWTMLTDRCLNLDCAKALTWQKLDHVSRCPACDADQRDFDTQQVAEELRPHLGIWVDLVHPAAERRNAARSRLPDALIALDPGTVFDLIFGLATVVDPTAGPESHLRAIARTTDIILGWPSAIVDLIDADAQSVDTSSQSLSTRLRSYAQSPSTLPEVRLLLLSDLARERGCPLGAKAEIAMARRKVRALGVREAATHIGIAPAYVTKLRRAGVLDPRIAARGRTKLELVTDASCESVRLDLENRMSQSEFVRRTGFSDHATEQLVEVGHIKRLRAPAIDLLFADPMLEKSSAERFIEKLRSRVFPLGNDDDDWIPLSQAFVAVGGRPKPYGSFITWLFENGASLRAPVGFEDVPDLGTLHVSPWAPELLRSLDSAFPIDVGAQSVSASAAAELLNCNMNDVQLLLRMGLVERCADQADGSLRLTSIVSAAKQLISFAEINARLGFRERSAAIWLRRNGLAPRLQGFALREPVEERLRDALPLGLQRRHAMALTIAQVHEGAADLNDREWDLVKAWVPRQRRSSRGVCDRSVVNAAIWVSATGKRWKDIPTRYGHPDASYSRYHHWRRTGTLQTISRVLARERRRQSAISRKANHPRQGVSA